MARTTAVVIIILGLIFGLTTTTVFGPHETVSEDIVLEQNNREFTESYTLGYRCGVILARLNILTDTGEGEYKRLSDKYFELGCLDAPKASEELRDNSGTYKTPSQCAFMDDDCEWYAQQDITSCEEFTGDEKEMCYGDLNYWRENRENR